KGPARSGITAIEGNGPARDPDRNTGPEAPALLGAEEPRLLERDAEVVRVGRSRHRAAEIDHAVLVEVEQALVERLHAVVLAVGDDLLDRLASLVRVHDAVEDSTRVHQ